ncbi:Crp/Fnr family transcriptional regulator [Skermanella rosea]|uniref:Crp/Fnr family transcriptional regulator n=1 Tax=Skermanella rosea TaxID=1817965 RepID=UPI0019330783|nr:Crp/Fnr family transcriptional regulator [Skermanella rosea]UEM06329.1 Crp/Fnr family transcriptional regulator [Skermanella rosea]
MLAAFRQNPLLSGLGVAEHAALASLGTVDTFPVGTVLYARGDPASRLFLVVEGTVGLEMPDDGGAMIPLDMLAPGDCAGEESLAVSACYDTVARAVTDAVAFSIDSRRLVRVLEQRFDLVLGMLVGMSARLRGIVQEITALKMASTAERLGAFLLELTDQGGPPAGAGPVTVTLPLSKQMLARKLGMKPESLSRAFGKLRRLGVRSDGRSRVILSDPERLRDFCKSDSFH